MVFPTFTRPIPCVQPGFAPAGVHSCDEATLQRWEEDHFRCPPYAYMLRHLISSSTGTLRQPNVNEKRTNLWVSDRLHSLLPCQNSKERQRVA